MRVTFVAELTTPGSLRVRKWKIPGDVFYIPGFSSGMWSVIHPVASFRRNPTLSWSSAKTGLHPDVGAGLADALPLPSSAAAPFPHHAQCGRNAPRAIAGIFNRISARAKVEILKMIAGYQITARHCAAIIAAP